MIDIQVNEAFRLVFTYNHALIKSHYLNLFFEGFSNVTPTLGHFCFFHDECNGRAQSGASQCAKTSH